ncbi:unnamed protein product [Rotaria sp. Silwood1]|nr:unnamed protein product [Rotaria sp. Silwood1]
MQNRLRSTIDYLKLFNSAQDCKRYLIAVETSKEKICFNPTKHELWAKDYPMVRDLHNQLVNQYPKFLRSLSWKTKQVTAYRGQGMKVEELQNFKENIGQLLSMNSFFSTSLSEETALEFALDALGKSDLVGVLFHIQIDITVKYAKPFVNIGQLSYYRHEKEVLFTMSSIFRIDSVEKTQQIDDNSIWIINLTLNNDDNKELKHLNEYLR